MSGKKYIALVIAAALLFAFTSYITKPTMRGSEVLGENTAYFNDTKDMININRAVRGELCVLNGIGEVKAQAIIDYRQSNGAFTDTDELLKVKGISEKLYNTIKAFICV